jgi:4-carboxymuconolactone decarboxylase
VHNNLVRAAYANPEMFRGFASLSGRVHSASHLSDRTREIVVLRVCGLLKADYQWRAHARIAANRGIDDLDVEALRSGHDEHFDGPERAAAEFAAAFEMGAIDDDAWGAARAFYSELELLDMALLAGFFGFASRLSLALDVEPDPPPADT